MSTPASPPAPPQAGDDGKLFPRYVLVLAVEAIVIAALYWLGRQFS